MRPILTREQLQQHQSYLSDMDVIWDPLYDFSAYTATTGHTQLTFFSTPVGQGTTSAPGSATGNKTLADTNMETANQLGKGNQFYMTGVEVLFFPGVDPGRADIASADVGEFVDDVYYVAKSGVLTFQPCNPRSPRRRQPRQRAASLKSTTPRSRARCTRSFRFCWMRIRRSIATSPGRQRSFYRAPPTHASAFVCAATASATPSSAAHRTSEWLSLRRAVFGDPLIL